MRELSTQESMQVNGGLRPLATFGATGNVVVGGISGSVFAVALPIAVGGGLAVGYGVSRGIDYVTGGWWTDKLASVLYRFY
ncbi:MAG: hypothetical protein A3J83_06150 [Elusimicrobia bacterium RIFOXYA2_FULL_40_6]|nr:MAG: hypothetical protein A3J83_06150 [Elusimicrobia bacterium RIFOXYA2_FULL_40_6]